MKAAESAREGATAKGFLKSIGDSIQSHLDERLRSPFAGAFIVAWLAINWQSVLILCFSQRSIEDRIAVVLSQHWNLSTTLWQPLGLAVLLAIGFYVAASIFVVFSEFYGVARSLIERGFDRIRWVSPKDYISFKTEKNNELARLQEIAADKLTLIEVEKQEVLRLSNELIEAREKLSTATASEVEKNQQISSQLQQINELTRASGENREISQAHINRLSSVYYSLIDLWNQTFALKTALLKSGAVEDEIKSKTEILEFKISALAKQLASVPGVKSVLDSDTSEESLSLYLRTRFPDLEINSSLLAAVYRDIHAHGLTSSLRTIRDVDRIVAAAMPAVEKHNEDAPTLFKSSVDILSKSLGFVLPEFRKNHKFGSATRAAFVKYASLVDDPT